MALERFSRSVTVPSDRAAAWQVVTDVETLTGWVGILHQVTELSRLESYKAVLQDKVGPFKLRAELVISVTVEEDGRRIAVSASGRDRGVDSKISVEAVLDLGDDDAGTTIAADGKYQVTGRVAAMGSAVIHKKADRILDDFFGNAERALS